MHVYCRRHVIGRFCVEHEGMQECETRLRDAFHPTDMSMRMCEMKSIMITRESPDNHVCIALTDGPDDNGNTYVLKLSLDHVRDILRQIDEGVTHLTFHYIECMSTDMIVTYISPNPSWRVGHDERPCLPNSSPPVSVDVFRILQMIREMV
jgi:hypothetical protein